MAVAGGRTGKVTVYDGNRSPSSDTPHTVAEMGEWNINFGTRSIVEFYSFGDTVARSKPGQMSAQSFTFSGYFDDTDTTGQLKLITSLTSGGTISNSSLAGSVKQLRLWANDDTTITEVFGFWSCTGSSGAVVITNVETGTNKDGIATISFTGSVTNGTLAWSTITAPAT